MCFFFFNIILASLNISFFFICFIGIGGIGKSTALKSLALSWEKKESQLNKFDFVFHIALKDVNTQVSLAKIILEQHKGLTANHVTENEISNLLDGKFKSNILVLIDGFDEYLIGTNDQMDSVLHRSSLWDSWIILTSRPFDQVDLIKPHFDAEATIIGFSPENIQVYASKFLGSEIVGYNFVERAKMNQILDILGIPLILQMTCVLFQSGHSLPYSKTETTKAIVDWSIEYSTYRQKHPVTARSSQRDIGNMLFKLGKLAWESLQRNIKQLLLKKVLFVSHFIYFFGDFSPWL